MVYTPLDLLKFRIWYVLSGKAWDNLLENKVGSFYFLISSAQPLFCLHKKECFIKFHFVGASCTKLPYFFHCWSNYDFMLSHHRLPSLQIKTIEKKRGKHVGWLHREHSKVFSLRNLPIFSMNDIDIENFQIFLGKPSDVLKLQGMPLCLCVCVC